MKTIAVIATVLVLGLAPALAQPSFEEASTLSAREVLPPELVKGPHHQIADDVANDGYLNTYTLESTFGNFTLRGEDLLRVRVAELEALAALAEVTKTEAFTQALGEAAMKPVETVTNVVTKPVETVKGIPSGVSRYFKRTSRKIKKTAKKVDETLNQEKKAEGEGGESGEGQGTLAIGVRPQPPAHELATVVADSGADSLEHTVLAVV